MLEAALKAQANTRTYCYRQGRGKNGHALMMCNGRSQTRTLQGSAGQRKLRLLRTHHKRDGQTFTSSFLLPHSYKTVTYLLFVWQDAHKAWPPRRGGQCNGSWRRER